MQARPERTLLAPGLEISRLVCGLWQVADIEKTGTTIDPEQGPMRWRPIHRQVSIPLTWPTLRFGGDHHRPFAEAFSGGGWQAACLYQMVPEPGPMTRDVVRRGVEERLQRLQSRRLISCNSIGGPSSIRPGWMRCTRCRR